MTLVVEGADGDAEHCDECRQHVAEVGLGEARLVRHHHEHPAETEQQAEPLATRDALAEVGRGDQPGEQRLQAGDQRRGARRQTAVDRDEHAAEVGGMDQQTGDGDVQHRAPGLRPARAGQHGDRQQDRADQRETDQQEGQRLGVRQAELGAEEAGAPQQHEQDRGQRDQHGPVVLGRALVHRVAPC